jgi:CYTH domain-containing protein
MTSFPVTSGRPHPPRSGEIVLSDTEGAQVRIFHQDDRFIITAERRSGGSLMALQAILSEEQYAKLSRFSTDTGAQTTTVEVERKWRFEDSSPRDIFDSLQNHGTLCSSVSIEQGYLVLGDSEVRLRRKGAECFLTLKGPGGRARSEVEVAISREQCEALWLATEGRRLEKTRTSFPLAQKNGLSLVVEVDEFRGRHAPLVLVECEFTSESAADEFQAPTWFGREVTEDAAYKNKALVRAGVPQVSLTQLRAPRPR